jgi:hypothetical protein
VLLRVASTRPVSPHQRHHLKICVDVEPTSEGFGRCGAFASFLREGIRPTRLLTRHPWSGAVKNEIIENTIEQLRCRLAQIERTLAILENQLAGVQQGTKRRRKLIGAYEPAAEAPKW